MRRIVTWSVRGRHPWIVIAVWIVVAGLLSMGPKLASVTSNDASRSLAATVESKRADALQQASFPDAKGTPVIVVYSSDEPLTAADKAAIGAGEDWLTGGAEPVNSARIEYSPDGKGALVFASLDGNPGDESFRDSVQAIRDHFGETVEGMQVRVTGPGGLITDVYQIFLNADVKLLVGTVILVLVLLLLIYRSPVLPFVPLVAVGFGYFVAGGILALAANALDVTLSGQATSLMVILLFGAGTDYGLLLISRYREDLRRESGRPRRPDHGAGRDLGGHRRQRPDRDAGGPHAALRPVRRLPLVRAGARDRRVRDAHRRAHAHAGAARAARPPRLLAARAQAGRSDDAPHLGARRGVGGRGAEAGREPGRAHPRRAGPRLPLLQPALQLHRGLPHQHALERGLHAARAALPQGGAGADHRPLRGAGGAARSSSPA